MPIIRTEFNFRRSTEEALEDIDISSFDIVGRISTDAKAARCAASEASQFVFADDADLDAPVAVVWFGRGGRMALRVNDTVIEGTKLTPDANGLIVASGTASAAVPAAGDFAVATETGSAGEFV